MWLMSLPLSDRRLETRLRSVREDTFIETRPITSSAHFNMPAVEYFDQRELHFRMAATGGLICGGSGCITMVYLVRFQRQ